MTRDHLMPPSILLWLCGVLALPKSSKNWYCTSISYTYTKCNDHNGEATLMQCHRPSQSNLDSNLNHTYHFILQLGQKKSAHQLSRDIQPKDQIQCDMFLMCYLYVLLNHMNVTYQLISTTLSMMGRRSNQSSHPITRLELVPL